MKYLGHSSIHNDGVPSETLWQTAVSCK